jgi:hypothetical protein
MKKYITIILFTFFYLNTQAQQKSFVIKNYTFATKEKMVKNEWKTKDKIEEIYLVKKGIKTNVLEYYKYKDEGGDCNNLFWEKGSMQVKHDSIIILTHYFQKTNLDPLPEWNKKIYKINEKGKFTLIFDKVKYYYKTKWVENNEKSF